ncbi:type II toxin-antitoxin system VapC family toxin, partial [Candidatus Woesearchaeota archaeon]|nr:type II toxin-antitoxin system VapC family toxin [Candidatus Woesearchaeota archaeon]
VKSGRKAELRQFVEGIYAIPNLEIKEVNSEIPLLALNFIEGFGLKPRDAFHAAVMESFAITEIVSDDSDFDRVKGIKRIKL